MTEKYKVSDLARILEVTPKTIYKAIENNEFEICKEKVNNREVTFVLLDEYKLAEAKELFTKRKGIDNNFNYENSLIDNYEQDIDTNQTNPQSNQMNGLMSGILALNDQYHKQLNLYIDRTINAEKKMLLLEDSESRQQSEYLKQINELKSENEMLKKELDKKTVIDKKQKESNKKQQDSLFKKLLTTKVF